MLVLEIMHMKYWKNRLPTFLRPLNQALTHLRDHLKEHEETLKSMELMWQLIHPKSGSNVCVLCTLCNWVAAPSKPSPAVSAATISAWSFHLSSTGKWKEF